VAERHILVVEDDQTLRDIIAEALLEDLLLRASCKALLWHRTAAPSFDEAPSFPNVSDRRQVLPNGCDRGATSGSWAANVRMGRHAYGVDQLRVTKRSRSQPAT
jgi:hypothetical protein